MELEVYIAPFGNQEGLAIYHCPECDALQNKFILPDSDVANLDSRSVRRPPGGVRRFALMAVALGSCVKQNQCASELEPCIFPEGSQNGRRSRNRLSGVICQPRFSFPPRMRHPAGHAVTGPEYIGEAF